MTASSQQMRTQKNDDCKTASCHAYDETNGGGRGTLADVQSDVPLCTIRTRATLTPQPKYERSVSSKHDDEASGGGRGALAHTHSDVPLSIL